MNHRSTFPVEDRSSSGHRYRHAPATAAAWPRNTAPSTDSWHSQNSWSDDSAWTPAEDEWTADESTAYDTGAYAPAWAPVDTEAPAPQPHQPHRAERRGGAHRVPAPPTALKGRAAVIAVAAGAVVAAGQAAMADPGQSTSGVDYEAAGQIHEIAAQSMNTAEVAEQATGSSPQVLEATAIADKSQFDDILAKGQKFAEDLAAQESAKLRPLFAKFTNGNYTSGFGARWGVQHLGIDVAGPIGTPIYAVADGTVVEAGPASGFGMWVRVLHDDGTITIYGHIDTATVTAGERVMAGDQIATMGNRGFSTGPHVHFEVWQNGTDKIDPVPWLATRGISLGYQRD
ncbi:M23 family metallopeptidase [Nocardia halotolerans]|uniref:M23 family metallopeptidase n=1 Tax=Nocardia halotolerans TaxID=1755878 RepID=A0ABV8VLV3_9NOCA